MAQIGWFRLKFPDGRISMSVQAEQEQFVSTARVYTHHNDPVENCLAEALASGSTRSEAQTSAVGLALSISGFGLQFILDDDSDVVSDDVALEGFTSTDETPAPEPPAEEPEELTYEAALKLPCPISKYRGKTLGDMITLDPKALTWVATKFSGDEMLSQGAKLICEESLQAASA